MHTNLLSPRHALTAGAAAIAMLWAAPGFARQTVQAYDLPVQPLGKALATVGRQSGRQIVAPTALVADKTAPALKGAYTADQAYAVLLAGMDLKLTPIGDMLVLQATLSAGEPRPADAETLSEVLVTGTRIRGAAPVGSSVITISRQDIEASGYATTQQIIQSIPQNYGGGPNDVTSGMSIRNGAGLNSGRGSSVNLRGLGTTSTLVLIDGLRPAMGGASGTFADLSLIPQAAIERVEVLADGASSLYGSDAVAGVVNIRMRQKFQGGETSIRYGSADGDLSEVSASQILGCRWDSGRLVVAYDYYQRDALKAADRVYASEDLRPLGGLDYRSNYASPGTIVAGGRNFAIPSGQNGVGLASGRLAADQINRGDTWREMDLAPRQRRHALYAAGTWEPRTDLEVSGTLLAAQRDFSLSSSPDYTTVTVPISNPFYVDPIGTRQPVRVMYNFYGDLGHKQATGRIRGVDVQAGVIKRLGGWNAGVSAGFGEQSERIRTDALNTYRLGLALADTNPATAYNVFGDPGSTNASTIDKVRGFNATRNLYDVWTIGVKADGPLFEMPGGAARLAVGGEIRDERFKQVTSADARGPAPTTTANAYPDGHRISAAYAELLLPFFSPGGGRLGVRGFDVSLSGRIEHYSDFGTTANPKVGVDWKPISTVTVKGSYGSSFRAPSFKDEIQGPNYVAYQPVSVPDPQSPTGTSIVLGLLGNPPKLNPEKARTFTTGLTWKPAALTGSFVSLTYFRVAYRDRITDPNANFFNLLLNPQTYASLINRSPTASQIAAYYADPLFVNPSNIAASDVKVILDARVSNLAKVTIEGVDLDMALVRPFAGGTLQATATASQLFKMDQAASASAPPVDVSGTVGNPPKFRVRGGVGWSNDRFDGGVTVNYIDNYTNQTVVPSTRVSSWTTTDLRLGYRPRGQDGILSGVRLSLSITNLFDRDPPFVTLKTISSTVGYDADNASPIGRLTALQVVKSW